jgi:hypothetical protein
VTPPGTPAVAVAFLRAGWHPLHSIVDSLLIFGALVTGDAPFGYSKSRLQAECAGVDAS